MRGKVMIGKGMSKVLAAIGISLIASFSSGDVFANLELAKKNACTACHAVDKKLLGPAYSDIAKKYKDQKDAVSVLQKSIKEGGSGKWGAVPMPAQPNLSEADAKILAEWILAGAK